MQTPDTFDYTRYLNAKETVDARALNCDVWDAFMQAIHTLDLVQKTCSIVELGGGTGTTARTLLEALRWPSVRYVMVDVEPANVRAARDRLQAWAEGAGLGCEVKAGETEPDATLVLTRDGDATRPAQTLTVALRCADAFAFAEAQPDGAFDALVAQAFLDLVHLDHAFERLGRLLRPGGLAYLPINFDGVTIFLPPAPHDATVECLFHASMDARTTPHGASAGSTSGRKLVGALRRAGADLVRAGGSDWVVHARDGIYPGDEAYFLHHILHFVASELRDHDAITSDDLDTWLTTRRAQIDDGTLVYMTHQIDVLARF
jgi:SAM-dependent methyltransferase